MIRTSEDIRIEGIRRTNTGAWAVVGSRPVGHDDGRITVLIREFSGPGAKANAIDAAGTNRIANPCTAHDFDLAVSA